MRKMMRLPCVVMLTMVGACLSSGCAINSNGWGEWTLSGEVRIGHRSNPEKNEGKSGVALTIELPGGAPQTPATP